MTVTVLSKPACVQCTATYRQLDKFGIEYSVVDITEDAEAYALAKSLGHMSAPVVIAGEQNWAGFQPARIEALASELKAA